MFWLRNKKIKFLLRTLNLSHAQVWQNTRKQLVLADSLYIHIRSMPFLLWKHNILFCKYLLRPCVTRIKFARDKTIITCAKMMLQMELQKVNYIL